MRQPDGDDRDPPVARRSNSLPSPAPAVAARGRQNTPRETRPWTRRTLINWPGIWPPGRTVVAPLPLSAPSRSAAPGSLAAGRTRPRRRGAASTAAPNRARTTTSTRGAPSGAATGVSVASARSRAWAAVGGSRWFSAWWLPHEATWPAADAKSSLVSRVGYAFGYGRREADRGLRAPRRSADGGAGRPRRARSTGAASRASIPAPASPPCSAGRSTAAGCWPRPARSAALERRYRHDTLILETVYETAEGAVRVIDFMPPRGRAPDIVRIVEGLHGRVPMRSELVVRFDYGRDRALGAARRRRPPRRGRAGRALLPHPGRRSAART